MKIPQITLDIVLEVYNPACRYLKEADLNYLNGLEATGRFSIPASFYIKDTGHFNAVEQILCYNQLAYVFFAEAGRLGLINGKSLTLDEFKEKQLGKYLIVGTDKMKFKKIINSRDFEGRIILEKIKEIKGNFFFNTRYDFGNGSSTGQITLASLR